MICQIMYLKTLSENAMSDLMTLQQEISAQKLQEKVGKTMMVLVDEIDDEEGIAICRSYADAPEIDGHVYVDDITAQVPKSWTIPNSVTIDDASEYDLFASYKG